MSCENACYEAQINACDDITLIAGLAAETAYYVRINQVGNPNVYQRQLTTDVDSKLVIPVDSFPAGFFNKYAGYFQMELRPAADYPTVQVLTFNEIQFSCVVFKIVATNIEDEDETPISVIQ